MITKAEYTELKARNARHDAWAQQFVQKNGWTVIPQEADKTCPENARISNEERSAIEVYEFCHDVPEKYFLYIKDNRAAFSGPGNVTPIGMESLAQTWTGERLGTVFFGREFRDNFGGKRIPITIRAINGRTYSGTYFKSSRDYARVKLVKEKARKAG